jgi:hypothetical protein
MILIAGGSKDPNIDVMQNTLAFLGYKFIRLNTDTLPVHWDINNNVLMAGKYPLEFDALYSRPNVFVHPSKRNEASIWHDVLTTYAIENDKLSINAGHAFRRTAKMRNLLLAKKCGFDIPKTYITSQADRVEGDNICKPVNGGAHTVVPDDLHNTLEGNPSIVQERLYDYDMRLYKVGDKTFAFYMQSESVDYRELQDAKVVYIEDESVYADYIQPTKDLAEALQLDYCCVDLKKNKEDEAYSFLEINTLPMHAAFDIRCGMLISKSICELLHVDDKD